MNKILITHAVKEEQFDIQLPCEYQTLITGIGKTKSAFALTREIILNKPSLVLNIGTAGSVQHNVGEIFIAKEFIDRDYESIKLPNIAYQIDAFSLLQTLPNVLKSVQEYSNLGVCSTGDTFITQVANFTADIVDMEAFSQAYVCAKMEIPFLSVKYITDKIGENSIKHWEDKLTDARQGLCKWFEQFKIFV